MSVVVSTSRAAFVAATLLVGATSASAMPLGGPLTASYAAPAGEAGLQSARFRGGRGFGGGGGGVGLGIGLGLLGGAILGGALSNDYYDNNQYYGGGDQYYYGGGGGGGDYSYCASRFRSYDPSSGTYLGYDGRRHSCP